MQSTKTTNFEFDIFQLASYAIRKELNDIHRYFINKSSFKLNDKRLNFLYFLMNVKNKQEINGISLDLVNI
jgi:hypothetical protein